MSSLIKRAGRSFMDCDEYTPISKKHYRPQHYQIQRKKYLTNNDYVSLKIDRNYLEVGVNKNRIYAHDSINFDHWKDSN